ncbi:MAG: nitroreductase [Anaerovoracaceae bacterium]
MKNETLTQIKTRRSFRSYKPDQIKVQELNAILEAGTYAPSGKNMQCPIIVAVQDSDTIAQLVKMNAQVMGTDSNPYYGAPTILLVFAPENQSTYVEDASCVLNTMMLAAHSLGLASCWIHREKQMFQTPEGKALMTKWGIDPNLKGIGALSLGYGGIDLPSPPERKPNRIILV